MTIHSSEALVLATRSYSNTSLIVTLFTSQFGKVRLVAKGVRAPKSRTGISLEPGTLIHSEWSIRESSELGTLRNCESLEVFHRLWRDFDAMNLAARLMKTIDQVIGLFEGYREHFELLLIAFRAIEANGNLKQIEAFFMPNLLRRLGLAPRLAYCNSCARKPGSESARLEMESGELRCGRCPLPVQESIRIKGATVKTMKEIMNMDLKHINSVRIHPALCQEVIDTASAFLSFQTGQSLTAFSKTALRNH